MLGISDLQTPRSDPESDARALLLLFRIENGGKQLGY